MILSKKGHVLGSGKLGKLLGFAPERYLAMNNEEVKTNPKVPYDSINKSARLPSESPRLCCIVGGPKHRY